MIETVQELARLDDVADMLAGLARHLTEVLDADGCLVSLIDSEHGTIRSRAGYARPP